MLARTFALGTAVGVAAMYWLDPQGGRRRRARSRQRATHATRRVEHAVGVAARDLAHRGEAVEGAFARWRRRRHVSDEVLVERVRARLGRSCSHPGAIETRCHDGRVSLHGPILAAEHGRLVRAVHRVPGVRLVIDDLHPVREAGHISALQGGRTPAARNTWAPRTRALAAITGSFLLAHGLRQRGRAASLACDVAGAALLLRSAETAGGPRTSRLDGKPAVTVRKTLQVRCPCEEAFALWMRPELFPRFMTHVRTVRPYGERRSHWTVTGPLRTSFDWDAEIVELEPNRSIRWRTLEGSDIKHAGRVTFASVGDRTDIHLELAYCPRPGIAGQAIARLLGIVSRKQLDDDLLRFKSLLENGKARGSGHAVRREELT